MPQIVLIESPGPKRDALVLNLKTFLKKEVIVRESAEDGIEMLKIFPDTEAIVTHSRIGSEKTAHLLADHLQETNCAIPFVVIGEAKFLCRDAVFLEEKVNPNSVVEVLKHLREDDIQETEGDGPTYIPIPVSYFLNLKNSCCDIFIRIKKDGEQFKYVKRIHSGESFDEATIQYYLENGLENFFIAESYLFEFTEDFTKQTALTLHNSLDTEKRVELSSHTYDYIQKHVREMGFDDNSVQLTQSLLFSISKNVQTNKRLLDYWKLVSDKKANYRFARIQLVAIVANGLIDVIEWGQEEHKEKLTFAALFHDMSLIREDMLLIHTQSELDNSLFSENEKKIVEEHAMAAGNAVSQFREAPLGVDRLIKEHHGAQNGVGFPNFPSKATEGLSVLFCLAEDVAVKILKVPPEQDPLVKVILEELREKYQHNSVSKKVFQALSSCVGLI